MIPLIRTILNPAGYHGHGRRPPFFEGWYFKLVDATEIHRYAVIPGVFLSDDPERQHAFVQVLDGRTGESTYHRYRYRDFWAAENGFEIRIGGNRFTAECIALEVERPDLTLMGTVRFRSINPWPVRWVSPGIMGPFAWLPLLQTYHGVVSLDHVTEGQLTINQMSVDFTGGRGYIEKDWGRAFPSAYIWFQTNHFQEPGTSLTASVATIPLPGWSFRGHILGLWYLGTLYRFATYTGARVEKLTVGDRTVTWVVRDRTLRLEMQATRAEGGLLHAPTTVEMGRRISETLDAAVEARLVRLQGGERVIFHGTGLYAGLEVVGDVGELVTSEVAV
jgi:hypothetical protein